MADEATATGLIILVGDHLWWDLEAIAHWGAGMQRVVLIGPRTAGLPGGAGDRLARFVTAHVPTAEIEKVWLLDTSSHSVRHVIGQQLGDTSRTWLVSGAGGTRTMSTAAYLAAALHAHAVFVTRDETEEWRRIDGGVESRLVDLDPRVMDRYSAAELLSVTWADERFDVRVRSTPVEPEIDVAARRAVDGAPWRSELEAAMAKLRARPGGQRTQSGFLFERFVLAVTRALGVDADDVLVGSLLTHGSQRVQEVDVVVNSGGRLHVIDCKLTTSTTGVPPATQLRDGDATGHHLADGAVQYILLRPNWVVDEAIGALADRLAIRIVDRTTLARRNLPAVLADLLSTRPDQNSHQAKVRPA